MEISDKYIWQGRTVSEGVCDATDQRGAISVTWTSSRRKITSSIEPIVGISNDIGFERPWCQTRWFIFTTLEILAGINAQWCSWIHVKSWTITRKTDTFELITHRDLLIWHFIINQTAILITFLSLVKVSLYIRLLVGTYITYIYLYKFNFRIKKYFLLCSWIKSTMSSIFFLLLIAFAKTYIHLIFLHVLLFSQKWQ